MAVFIRRHADILGKLKIKIARRVIADHLRDARDRELGRDEQGLRLSDAAAQQILHGRIAAHFLEHMGQVFFFETKSESHNRICS